MACCRAQAPPLLRVVQLVLLLLLCGGGLPQQQQQEQQQQNFDDRSQPCRAAAAAATAAACGEAGEELFGEAPMRGMHILRAVPSSAVPHCGVAACPLFELELWVDGMRELAASHRLTVDCRNATRASVTALLAAAVRRVRVSEAGLRIPPEGSVARHVLETNRGFSGSQAGQDEGNEEEWGFYSPHGAHVSATGIASTTGDGGGGSWAAGLLRCERMLAFEGGLFIWPGVRVGYRRTVQLLPVGDGGSGLDPVDLPMPPSHGKPERGHETEAEAEAEAEEQPSRRCGAAGAGSVTMVTQSLQPLAFLIDALTLISSQECDHIIAATTPILEISDVNHFDHHMTAAAADAGHDAGHDGHGHGRLVPSAPSTKWRRSLQARLPNGYDDTITGINRRVASVLKLPIPYQEPLQALKYEAGGKYDAHWDYFDPSLYREQGRIMEMIDQDGSRNRIATMLFYLNDINANDANGGGGETFFPRSGGLLAPRDVLCEEHAGTQGMKVTPSRGKVLFFYSLRPDGAIDPFSLHGSCPVTTTPPPPPPPEANAAAAAGGGGGGEEDTAAAAPSAGTGDDGAGAGAGAGSSSSVKWVASQRVWTRPWRPLGGAI
jgi:hypothetical protein